MNTGIKNNGNGNSDDNNTGDNNSGNYNTGNDNTGDYNTGSSNTGHYNACHNNIGNGNTGDSNIGSGNSGNYNVGDYNTGDYNNGNGNVGDYNAGVAPVNYFCNFSDADRPVFFFNKPAQPNSQNYHLFRLFLHIDMSGGLSYKEAWAKAWDKENKETKNIILGLPNFDHKIFQDITGISVEQKQQQPVHDEIVIDGERYKLVKIVPD